MEEARAAPVERATATAAARAVARVAASSAGATKKARRDRRVEEGGAKEELNG